MPAIQSLKNYYNTRSLSWGDVLPELSVPPQQVKYFSSSYLATHSWSRALFAETSAPSHSLWHVWLDTRVLSSVSVTLSGSYDSLLHHLWGLKEK